MKYRHYRPSDPSDPKPEDAASFAPLPEQAEDFEDGIYEELSPEDAAQASGGEPAAAPPPEEEQKPKKKKVGFWRSLLPWKGDRPGEIIRKCIMIVAIITFLVSGSMLINELVILPAKNDNIMGELQNMYRPKNPSLDVSGSASGSEDGEDSTFDALLARNSETKGWLQIPNTVIDYPVLQSGKAYPEFYLYLDFDKNYSQYGSIFIDTRCSLEPGQETQNIILHGHNMWDGRMFTDLLKYDNLDFYRSTPVITFDTIYEKSQWKVFAVFKTNTLSSQGEPFRYLVGDFATESDFLNYIYNVRIRSELNTPVDIRPDDTILTLSTCSYEYTDFRTVVMARKVREGEDLTVDVDQAGYNPQPLMPQIWYDNRGGSAPNLPATFQEAYSQGLISWFTPPSEDWQLPAFSGNMQANTQPEQSEPSSTPEESASPSSAAGSSSGSHTSSRPSGSSSSSRPESSSAPSSSSSRPESSSSHGSSSSEADAGSSHSSSSTPPVDESSASSSENSEESSVADTSSEAPTDGSSSQTDEPLPPDDGDDSKGGEEDAPSADSQSSVPAPAPAPEENAVSEPEQSTSHQPEF